ncbi:MAG: major facilitator superfamily domain-containing protein 6 [Anaerolineales bacterium]
MFFPAAFYFLVYAAISFLFPFLTLFYQSVGMSGGQIGLLAGLSPLISLAAGPFWTGTADATRRHKAILTFAMVGAGSAALLLSRQTQFGWLVAFLCLYAFVSAPIFSLVDSATLSMLGERRARYGRVRLWGTVGWGVMAPVAGELIERFGIQWSFWGYAILLGIGLFIALNIPFHQIPAGGSFRSGMRTLLTDRRWMLFLLMVFFAGVGMSSVNNYLFIYMNGLGAGERLMGLALTVSTLSELPVMFFGDRLLRRFGARGTLCLAMAVIGLRLLLYSVTRLPWAVLLIQLLHGLTFPAIYLAGVSYADQSAPPGVKASAQGMFGSALMGFGASAGGLLGGLLLQRLGAAGMYRSIGLIVWAALLLFASLERGARGKAQSSASQSE